MRISRRILLENSGDDMLHPLVVRSDNARLFAQGSHGLVWIILDMLYKYVPLWRAGAQL
jgi:hypothetical protein